LIIVPSSFSRKVVLISSLQSSHFCVMLWNVGEDL
jgi:hypothetical protein